MFVISNQGRPGDSGGPVFYDDGTHLHLIGIVAGGGSDTAVVRIENVMRELGVTPITNDNINALLDFNYRIREDANGEEYIELTGLRGRNPFLLIFHIHY